MPYITTRKDSKHPVRLYYEDWGEGNPVVFVHGWPVSHEMWEYQLTQLPQEGFRCIAYDRRGFGQSDKPWDGYDYTTLATDLKALLDELDLEGVTLVGFSMAGGEVVRYCSLYNCERLSQVVLVSSIVPYMLQTETNPDGVPQEIFDNMLAKLEEDRPAFLAEFGKQFFGVGWASHPVSDEILDWMQGLALCGSPRATIECAKSFSGTDFRREMKNIRVPVMIIHGDADKTVPIEPTGAQAAKMLPNAIYRVYEGAPHGLFIIDQQQLNQDLAQFISTGSVTDYRLRTEEAHA